METLNEISEIYSKYPWICNIIIVGLITLTSALIIERKKRGNTLKDNKRLIKETEEVKSYFSKQLEELKRDHQLDLQKRKYLYESKTKVYSNFFLKVDNMNTEINIKSAEKMQVFISEYTKNLMRCSSEKERVKATVIYQKKTQTLMMDASQALIQLKHETNEIRLHASDDVIEYLNFLEMGYSKLIEVSNQLLSMLPKLVLSNSDLINTMQAPLFQQAALVETVKSELINQMRLELKQI
ncbi:hypothetical protein [uncultured Chryseobacterium sp.]|uniref:hypothetical protein n=1 Tax=uncultured Chryseobacterium sp. TaxID=259322 RepID=UPI0025FE29E0|nr:hypothetical protein [uncultured Chryseobacterium sp.]